MILKHICNVEKTIYLRDVLMQMRKLDRFKEPVPFNIVVREFNRQNKSAGKLREYRDCKLMQKGSKRKVFKNPDHWNNRTRNVKLPDGSIKKIHIIYIVEFNGLKVLY